MITLKPPFRAENMQGLYKKVLRGHYPKISKQYSTDIQTVVRMLIQVSSKKRPSCAEILSHAIVKKKIKELSIENDDEMDTETDTFKKSLLKTIYFPKDSQSILYLTDKLPKPNYGEPLEVDIDDKKRSYRANSESPILDPTKDSSSIPGSYKRTKKKAKGLGKRSIGSKDSETGEGTELQTIIPKISPTKSIAHTNSIEKLPEVVKPHSNSPNKMSSIERIASRIEETKSKPLMNIDREYQDLKKLLDNKQKERDEEHKYMVPNIHKLNANLIDKTQLKKPKYIKDKVLYSVKEEQKYKHRAVYKSQKRPEGDSKVLNLGIVGEQVGSVSSRAPAKGHSVEMKLPRIAEGAHKVRDPTMREQNSSDNIKLPNLQKYKHGKYFLDEQRAGHKKYPSHVTGNYRYKYGSQSNQGIYESYIGKGVLKSNRSNKALDKLKMYQNNMKASQKDYEKVKKKVYQRKPISKYLL